MTWLLVALGGAAGTALRHGANLATVATLGASWPYGTFFVNVLGSFALGVVMEALGGRTLAGVDLRLVLGTGLLGGFTTYSSFNLETIRLWEQGAQGRASAYVIATVVLCLGAGFLGLAAARALKA